MTNSSRAGLSRGRIRRMAAAARPSAKSLPTMKRRALRHRPSARLSAFAWLWCNCERRCPETLRLPDRANTNDEWMCQQALKFNHLALVHIDTALSVNDIDSTRSVALLYSRQPIGKIFNVRASWQSLQDSALSSPAGGDHAHSEHNNSEIFSSQHRLIHSKQPPTPPGRGLVSR